MAPRLQLQSLLDALPGVTKAYFQPGSNISMEYPCIVYELDDITTTFADNLAYRRDVRYQVTLISRDPEPEAFDRLLDLPKCSFDRAFKADNLNHFVFTLYY